MKRLLLALLTLGAAAAERGNAPTDYAPLTNLQCPDTGTTNFIRQFSTNDQAIPAAETAWIAEREKVVAQAWKDWVGDGSSIGYDLTKFEGKFPRAGLALPGGGLRAAQYGAAVMNALDSRNDTAKSAGTGGLLQVLSYITGLSGGSWVTGSMFFNDWPRPYEVVFGNGNTLDGWKLDLPFASPDGSNVFSDLNQDFFGSILWSVIAKAQANIDTSLTDPWSRMIAYHFLNQTTRSNFFTNESAHGAGQLWSNIMKVPSVQQFKAPFPIVVTDSRPAGSNVTTRLALEETVYEISPLEFASYDPQLSAGVNLTFAGTHLLNGKPDNGSACVNAFDDAGFIMGTSASLFNQIFDTATNTLKEFDSDDSNTLVYLLQRQLRSVRTRQDEVSNWPNPFNGLKSETFKDSGSRWLDLLDGASNAENVPYGPLLVKSRAVDVIITAESSADLLSFPNGSSLTFTYQRAEQFLKATHQPFPPIPDVQGFIDQGLVLRPTLFGCEPTRSPPEWPLVIYLPNSPPANGDDPVTNSATFRLTYTLKHTSLFFDQVFKSITSGFTPKSRDPDPNWPKCMQCAAIDRGRYRNATSIGAAIPRSDICTACFKQYCYNPQSLTSKSDIPERKFVFVDPDPQGLDRQLGFFADNKFKLLGGLIGLIILLGLMVGGLIWWKRKQKQTRYAAVAGYHSEEHQPIVTPKPKHGRTESYMTGAESYEMPRHSRYQSSLGGSTVVEHQEFRDPYRD